MVALPTDPDDLAELRLQVLRLMAPWLRQRAAMGHPNMPFPIPNAAQELGLSFEDAQDQFLILEAQGAVKCGRFVGQADCAVLTPFGLQWAQEGDGQENARRRRRILRFLDDDRERTGKPNALAYEIAEALGVDERQLTGDLAFLSMKRCITINTSSSSHTSTVRLIALTDLGVLVAREGWAVITDDTPHQSIHVGDNAQHVTIGQGRDFTQRVHIGQDGHTELREFLNALKIALEHAADLPESDRENGLDAVDRIGEEFDREQPRRRRIESALRALSVVADVAGTAQGAMMVSDLIGKLTPHVQQACQALT